MTSYLTYCRISAGAREEHLPGLNTTSLGDALAGASSRSEHPLQALQPFYMAVYDAERAYPVAVFRGGERLEGAALEFALTAGGEDALQARSQA
jgi:hypothetical protein